MQNQEIDFNLVLNNLNFAKYFANKYRSFEISFDDLYSESILGLIDASKVFIPERGIFSSIAKLYIKNRIFRFLAKNKYAISFSPERFSEIKDLDYKDRFLSKDNDDFNLQIKHDNDYSLNNDEFLKSKKEILSKHLNCLTNGEKLVISSLIGIRQNPISIPNLSKKSNLKINTINDLLFEN